MEFKTESEMGIAVRKLLEEKVLPKTDGAFQVLKSDKALDIPICKEGDNPKLFFLELKCRQSSHGRLGIGHGYGGGFQVEILKKMPDYFEKYLKWLLAYPEMHPEKYLLLNTSDVRKNVSGGDVGKKHNNIRPSVFKDYTLLDEDELISGLIAWLLVDDR